ncbi:MAG: tyrosine-type recombinase/integrase [Nitrososphaeraceae archaeon]
MELKTILSSSADQELVNKIETITQHQRPYLRKIFLHIAAANPKNAKILCDYIIAEQNEINIKESTKQGKIKNIVWLIRFLNNKNLWDINKEDILLYLSSLRKPLPVDPSQRSIGTYNSRQMIFLKFFKWLFNPEEPDPKKRITPPCMVGVRRLPRQQISPYKPSDLWTDEEHSIFLKYCPLKRDKAFHAMASDTSARPHELLNLKIKDIKFKISVDAVQYAEILVSGKTKPRTLPLIYSIPYIKEWIQVHPQGNNPESWLFVSLSKNNRGSKLSDDGLLKQYKEQYRDRFFPMLLNSSTVPERDKAYIRNMLTKPWNLYVFRHSALTQKSQILKEHVLRSHAGWSITSKMPQVYIHYFGNESSNSILEAYGIVKEDHVKRSLSRPRQCPNCNESNTEFAKFCIKCRMILSYEAYQETVEEKQHKNDEMKEIKESVSQLRKQVEIFISSINVVDPSEKQKIISELIEKGVYNSTSSKNS